MFQNKCPLFYRDPATNPGRGAFPDGKSCLNLAAARLRHIAGTQWATRKYMNMTSLFSDQIQGAVIA